MKHELCAAILVGGGLGAHASGVIITETFDSGIPASWSTFDYYPNGSGPAASAFDWTTNGAEGLANFTAGTGTAAAASSNNHIGPYDVSLWTPAFTLPAGPNNFKYKVNYQHVDAAEALDTRLSINGGPWVTMVHQTASLGASYSSGAPNVTVGISLDFFGASPGDVCIVQFRYFTSSLAPTVSNQYVEIDDVEYPVVPAPGAPFACSIVAAGCGILRRRR